MSKLRLTLSWWSLARKSDTLSSSVCLSGAVLRSGTSRPGASSSPTWDRVSDRSSGSGWNDGPETCYREHRTAACPGLTLVLLETLRVHQRGAAGLGAARVGEQVADGRGRQLPRPRQLGGRGGRGSRTAPGLRHAGHRRHEANPAPGGALGSAPEAVSVGVLVRAVLVLLTAAGLHSENVPGDVAQRGHRGWSGGRLRQLETTQS